MFFQSIQCYLSTYLCGSLRCLQNLFCQKLQRKISYLFLRMQIIHKRCSSCPRSCSESMQNMTSKIQVDCIIAPYTKSVKRKSAFLHTEDERATILSFSLNSYKKPKERHLLDFLSVLRPAKQKYKAINSFQSCLKIVLCW